MTRPCLTPTCENVLPERARSETVYCAACRSSAAYWGKKSVKAMLWRRDRLKFFGARLNAFITKRGNK
jgi:hypothetical protein